MTDSYQKDHIRWLRRLATLADNPISTRLAELDHITEELTHLDGATPRAEPRAEACTGRVHWRDKDHPDRKPKMYVIHSIDDPCPLHGTPPPGGRLRVYVGTDSTKQQEARTAIRREQTRRDLEKRQKGILYALQRCGYYISRYYDSLGYIVPRQDQPALYPEPNPDWTPPLAF